jgi:hypothetical protein
LVFRVFAPLMLASTLVTITACAESASESAVVAECPQADAADATAITQERADMLIGLTESDAESCATSLGWAFRVGERDGESFALTADYSLQRVTVSVTKDLVTAVAVG